MLDEKFKKLEHDGKLEKGLRERLSNHAVPSILGLVDRVVHKLHTVHLINYIIIK